MAAQSADLGQHLLAALQVQVPQRNLSACILPSSALAKLWLTSLNVLDVALDKRAWHV